MVHWTYSDFARATYHSQAVSKIDCSVKRLGVDFLTVAGHKYHAPKGAWWLQCILVVILYQCVHCHRLDVLFSRFVQVSVLCTYGRAPRPYRNRSTVAVTR